MNWNPNQPAYDRLISALLAEVDTAFVVGGAVRDYLRNRRSSVTDLDIVIAERANPVARRVADQLGWAFYPMGTGHDVARLVLARDHGPVLTCDFAGMRGASIEDDLAARDFTVNAMAITLGKDASTPLLDPFGGRKDLEARVLKRVSPVSLLEDPIRLLRAVRLMVQFDLEIESATRGQVERLTDTIRLSSTERARDELWRMLANGHPRRAMDLLQEFGLLRYVLPEVAATQGVEQSEPHYQDVYQHTIATVELATDLRDWLLRDIPPVEKQGMAEVLDLLTAHKYDLRRHLSQQLAAGRNRAEWLVWHALLHDVGKPDAAVTERSTGEGTPSNSTRIRFHGHEVSSADLASRRLTALRFSNNEVALCAAVLRAHMRPHSLHSSFATGEISRRAAFRFFRDVGGKQFGRGLGVDTLILAVADYLATYRELPDTYPVYLAHVRQLLDDYFASGEGTTTAVEPLVNGHELIHLLDIRQGKRVGELLDQIMESQAAGEVNTREEAIELAKRLHRETVP